MLISGVDLLKSSLWAPLILLEVYILALGFSLFLSALYVKFRDISYIWEVILQAGFYITPILYPLTLITNLTLQKLIILNPIAQAIQDLRFATITHQTKTIYQIFEGGWYKLIPFFIVAAVFVSGVAYFKSKARYFAEEV
jgi:ABC-2 type transport system permease protein